MTTRQTRSVWVPTISFEDTDAVPRVGEMVANNHYILLRYTRVCAFQDTPLIGVKWTARWRIKISAE